MRSGPLRNRLKLWEEKLVQNGSGGFDMDWVELPGLWGDITIPTGRTGAVAERLAAVVSAEIVTRPLPRIVAGRRLSHAGVTYHIEAVLPDNRGSMFRVLCSSVPNP